MRAGRSPPPSPIRAIDVKTLDFTSLNLANYEVDKIIGGGIEKHGWVVVKGNITIQDNNFVTIVDDCGITCN